jgi:hypothetical protein
MPCHRIADRRGYLAQLTEAAQRGGPLSFEDKLCLVLARDNGWICLFNDGPLREACQNLWNQVIAFRVIDVLHHDYLSGARSDLLACVGRTG